MYFSPSKPKATFYVYVIQQAKLCFNNLVCLFLGFKGETSELKFCEFLGSITLLDLICSKFNHEYNFGFLPLLPRTTHIFLMMIYFELLLIINIEAYLLFRYEPERSPSMEGNV
jgi:hypothetical protein